MREHIFAASLRFDESEAFGVVEPLDCPEGHTPPPVVFSADSGWHAGALSIRRWMAGFAFARAERGVCRTTRNAVVIPNRTAHVTHFRACGSRHGLNMPSLRLLTVNSIE